MKFPQITFMNKCLAARLLLLLVCVAAVSISISAQKKRFLSSELLAIGVDIEQCANGPQSAPIFCNVSSANDGYTRGALIASKSHYVEGQSVPIRIVATGLTIGQEYTVTIGYDFTKGGQYANDYLTDYDRTESMNNNPCVGVTGCTLASEVNVAFPIDSDVTDGFDQMAGTADDIVQIPGSISCFGCATMPAPTLSGYTITGSQDGDSSKSITFTFTAAQETVVIAYGSHISTRADWGVNNSAINISGSPYHNFIVDFPGANQGNRDLQLSAEAIIVPALVRIIKSVSTLGAPPGTTSTFEFDFTASANLGTGPFTLIDNVEGTGGGGTASLSVGDLTLFGAANVITVTEADYSPNWTLSGISCVEDPGGLPQTDNSSGNIGTRTATITLEEGEFVTCTFFNTQFAPTAAPASVSGRVTDSFGNGVSSARLTMTDDQSGNSWSVITNPFGYYTIADAEVGNFYMMTVSHKRYSFIDDTRTFSLNEDLVGMDFIANP